MASVGLDALGRYKLAGVVPLKTIMNGSIRVGDSVRWLRGGNGDSGSSRPPEAQAPAAQSDAAART
jgi:hypothetical protein